MSAGAHADGFFVLAFALPAPEPAAGGGGDADTPLVQRASQGDRRAFDQLYQRHVDLVARRLARLVGPDPEREDLIQQVFLEAFRGLGGFRGEAQFSTWIYRIVINVAYEHLRRTRRRQALPLAPEAWDLLVAPDASPEEQARQRQQLTRALGLLDRIKPKKRVAFVLRTVEGLSLDEIGALVGASGPAVGQRVKHAQRELAALIDRDQRRRGGEERN